MSVVEEGNYGGLLSRAQPLAGQEVKSCYCCNSECGSAGRCLGPPELARGLGSAFKEKFEAAERALRERAAKAAYPEFETLDQKIARLERQRDTLKKEARVSELEREIALLGGKA